MAGPGPLLAADELLVHQHPSTFARVAQSDRSWTEKVWAMAAAADGSLSVAFGLGKYVNRNVLDAFAGISRGTEQWTVRGSRRLAPTPEVTAVGPISYEVVEPLRRVRIALAENDVVPIAFDVELIGAAPPAVEEPEVHTSRSRYRIDAEVVRFHQAGRAAGWVRVDGTELVLDEDAWVGARDRSWGVRYGIGAPPEDVEATPVPPGTAGFFLWMPVAMRSETRSPYTLFAYHQRYAGPGWSTGSSQGAVELHSGRRIAFSEIEPDFRFDDATRRFLGGTLRCRQADGTESAFAVEPAGTAGTGFYLGTGLYGGWEGNYHGQYRGELHVDGEHIAGCDTVAVARRLRQHRDCIVAVTDLSSGDTGVGTLQTGVTGAHPEMGLTEEASFL